MGLVNAQSEADSSVIGPRLLERIDALASRYAARRLALPLRVADGVVNVNYRVETTAGPLFVRFHRGGITAEAVHLEQQVLRWAGDRGIPVILPLAAADGSTVQSVEGAIVSVYPWRELRPFTSNRIGPAGAAALGAMLGQLHQALADLHELPLVDHDLGAALNTGKALAELAQVAEVVRDHLAPGEQRHELLAAIAFQSTLLEGAMSSPAFDDLPWQAIHGDYHPGNVLSDGAGKVAAVIDWEMTRRSLRVYELLRCLAFSGLFESPRLVRIFTAGYARRVTLSDRECEGGVELWWRLRLHSTWMYCTRFLDGDTRVEHLLSSSARFFERFADAAERTSLAGQLGG